MNSQYASLHPAAARQSISDNSQLGVRRTKMGKQNSFSYCRAKQIFAGEFFVQIVTSQK